MALIDSSQVSPGDQATSQQYNFSRKDAIYLGGDYSTSAGSSNAYTLSLDSSITAYEEGMRVSFKASFTNTNAVTLNVNSIGAVSIKKFGDLDLVAGDIVSGKIIDLKFDGTNFVLMNLPNSQGYEFLGSRVLGAASSSINISDLPAKNFLRFILDVKGRSATASLGIRFNGDTANNYGFAFASNLGSPTTTGGTDRILVESSDDSIFLITDVINNENNPKMTVSSGTRQNGPGTNAPSILSGSGIWNNTSVFIDEIEAYFTSPTFDTGSGIYVYGKN